MTRRLRTSLIAGLIFALGILLGRHACADEDPLLGSDTCLDKVGRLAGALEQQRGVRLQLLLEAEGRVYLILVAPHGGSWTMLRVSIPGCEITGAGGEEHIALPLIGEGL